jgi:antitoxin component of RelBE/YafQ-DinJ toxin-antitoxin module
MNDLKSISVKLDPELRTKLNQVCEANGMNISSFVRFSIIQMIKERDYHGTN